MLLRRNRKYEFKKAADGCINGSETKNSRNGGGGMCETVGRNF